MVSAVILNYNDSDTSIELIKKIRNYRCFNKIVVVDNMSTDDSYTKLSKLSDEKIVVLSSPKNGGYGFGNNFGIRYILENQINDLVLICNPDVFFEENVVINLEKEIRENENTAVVAPMMKNKFGEHEYNCAWKLPENAWNYIFGFSPFFHRFCSSLYYDELKTSHGKLEVDAVAGSLFMIDAKAFNQAGLYDEEIFLYCEEDCVGLKMKNMGLKTELLLDESFTHIHSVSISKAIRSKWKQEQKIWESRGIVLKKYYGFTELQMIFYKVLKRIVMLYFKYKII